MPICKCGFKYPKDGSGCPLCGSKEPTEAKGVGLPNKTRDRGLQRKSEIKRGKRPNPVGKGKRRRLQEKGKETAVFIEIWREREHVCQNKKCGAVIRDYRPINFHHLKTKGAHPKLRYDKLNIALLCAKCHEEAHRKGNGCLWLPEEFTQ